MEPFCTRHVLKALHVLSHSVSKTSPSSTSHSNSLFTDEELAQRTCPVGQQQSQGLSCTGGCALNHTSAAPATEHPRDRGAGNSRYSEVSEGHVSCMGAKDISEMGSVSLLFCLSALLGSSALTLFSSFPCPAGQLAHGAVRERERGSVCLGVCVCMKLEATNGVSHSNAPFSKTQILLNQGADLGGSVSRGNIKGQTAADFPSSFLFHTTLSPSSQGTLSYHQ